MMKKCIIVLFIAILFVVADYEYEKNYMWIMTGYDYDYFAGHPIISRDNIIVVEASVCSYSINKDYILVVRVVEYWRKIDMKRETEAYLKSIEQHAKTVANVLQSDVVDYDAILGAIGEEYESRSIKDDVLGLVFSTIIGIDQDYLMVNNQKVSFSAGMRVTAEIKTGERRVISYLLSPLRETVSESMRER